MDSSRWPCNWLTDRLLHCFEEEKTLPYSTLGDLWSLRYFIQICFFFNLCQLFSESPPPIFLSHFFNFFQFLFPTFANLFSNFDDNDDNDNSDDNGDNEDNGDNADNEDNEDNEDN